MDCYFNRFIIHNYEICKLAIKQTIKINKLSLEKRAQIIRLLVEGHSLRSIEDLACILK
jgi:uncharacterized protein YerC